MNNKLYKLHNKADGQEIKTELIKKWSEIENTENLFRYKLKVEHQKRTKGKLNFFIQLNSDRTTKRRTPQVIESIVPAFNPELFNFNRVNKDEILFDVEVEQTLVTILINNSPLTKYHCLLCPALASNQPQILTLDCLLFAVSLLTSFDDTNFKIGFNSPGAMASVNHLHMHLMYVEESLYVENVNLKHLTQNLYKLNNDNVYPADAFCFQITNLENKHAICTEIMMLVKYFCDQHIPHNIFIAFSSRSNECQPPTATTNQHENYNILRIFLFPRDAMCINKEFTSFNVAFCELSGYVPVGNHDEYETLTEDAICEKIKQDIGNIMEKIESKVCDLYLDKV